MQAAQADVARGRALAPRRRTAWLDALLDHEQRLGYLLIAPVVLLLLGLVAYPFCIAVGMALSDRTIGSAGHFIGLTNFQNLLKDPIYVQTLHNTLIYTGGATVVKLVGGLRRGAADQRAPPFRKTVRSAILLPWIVPAVLGTMAWMWVLAPNFSVLNWLLINLGLIKTGIPWLVNPTLALVSVIMVNAWRGIPFFAITLLAGLQAIPQELYEATAIDGAGKLGRFWYVTLPLMLPILLITARALDHLDVLRFPDRLRPDRRRSAQQHATAGHAQLPGGHRVGAAGRSGRDLAHHAAGAAGAGRRPDLLPAADGRGVSTQALRPRRSEGFFSAHTARRADRLLTVYVPLALVLFFLLAPFYWMAITSIKPNSELYAPGSNPFLVLSPSLEHYQQLLAGTEFPLWTRNTMVIAMLATLIALLLGVPAGYALARLRFRGAGFIGLAIFATYLVPTTLLFLPMLQVVKTIGLQDNFWSLVLIYPTFLTPFCTWLMAGYFKTIPAELEECARIDGATRFSAMWRIAFPLATPGHPLGRHLLVHAELERVHLRAHLRHRQQLAHHPGRRADAAHPRRRLLLGAAHGGCAARLDSGGARLLVLRRAVRHRPDRRRRQGMTTSIDERRAGAPRASCGRPRPR